MHDEPVLEMSDESRAQVLAAFPTAARLVVVEHEGEAAPWWSVEGKECQVTIESRPYYCDRGRYIAKLHPRGGLALSIDASDCWPRYYFDWDRMLLEVEAWLTVRGQLEEREHTFNGAFCSACGADEAGSFADSPCPGPS